MILLTLSSYITLFLHEYVHKAVGDRWMVNLCKCFSALLCRRTMLEAGTLAEEFTTAALSLKDDL